MKRLQKGKIKCRGRPRKALNAKPKLTDAQISAIHARKPKTGDVWVDCGTGEPVLLVIGATKHVVLACIKGEWQYPLSSGSAPNSIYRRDVRDRSRLIWEWDLTERTQISRQDFRTKFRCKVAHKLWWAYVRPERDKEAAIIALIGG